MSELVIGSEERGSRIPSVGLWEGFLGYGASQKCAATVQRCFGGGADWQNLAEGKKNMPGFRVVMWSMAIASVMLTFGGWGLGFTVHSIQIDVSKKTLPT